MNVRIKISLMFMALVVLLMNDATQRPAKSSPLANVAKRIRFAINTIEESREQQKIISSALIEGAPGTDFDIDLNGERFKISAKFLTDVADHERLHIRADLKTRRLYGISERHLPLYEEDEQRQTLQLGFDEQVILLPFGRSGGDERLRIEITPMMTDEAVYLPNGKMRPLEIKLPIVSPGGVISIQARKIPHHFDVEVSLLENGEEIARANGQVLLKEKQELLLQPAGAKNLREAIAINFSVEDCLQARPVDDAVINFDVYRQDPQNAAKRTTIGLNWSGVMQVGKPVSYPLPDDLSPSGKGYELRFNVKIAQGEIVE
ncbi:MAG: hypothetical protein AB1757_14155 [Acidobacteriota bacterium]